MMHGPLPPEQHLVGRGAPPRASSALAWKSDDDPCAINADADTGVPEPPSVSTNHTCHSKPIGVGLYCHRVPQRAPSAHPIQTPTATEAPPARLA